MNSEHASAISGSSSTRGFISSRICVRSIFFAQPGKAWLRRLRASRTRLLTTICECGPSPWSHSPECERRLESFIASDAGLCFKLPDAVPEQCRGLVVLLRHGFLKVTLERFHLGFEFNDALEARR